MYIGVIKFGMENWKIDEISLEENEVPYSERFNVSSNPVFMDGCCYCLDVNGKVGIFDPNDVINS